MSQRIVICDDEVHVTRSVSMKLTKAGFNVESAADGLAALDAIRREIPALLITDCQMPRMGGIELCRQLRSDPPTRSLPIIMLTAKGYEFEHDALKSAYGISHIVLKPFSPRELLQIVESTVGAAHPSSE